MRTLYRLRIVRNLPSSLGPCNICNHMFVGIALCAHMVEVMWLLSTVERRGCRRSSLRESEVSWTWPWLVLDSWRGLTSKTSRSRSSGPLSLEVSSWRVLSFSEQLTSLLRSEVVLPLQPKPYTSYFVLDLLLLVGGYLVVVLGRRHSLAFVKSQQA